MPTVQLADTFGTFASKFSIRDKHALEAVEKADQTHDIQVNDLHLKLFQRRVPLVEPALSLLVVARVVQETVVIESALKAYADLAPGNAPLAPLDTLGALSHWFGLLLKVGVKTGRFFVNERIPWDGGDPLTLLEGANRAWVGQSHYLVEHTPQPVVHCALIYVLDVEQYVAWLKSH